MAQIEPRLKGDWKLDSSSKELHFIIQADGSYQKSSGGRIVESGKLRAIDGKWNVSGGSLESGTFSVIGNKLIFRGSKSGTTHWEKVSTSTGNLSAITNNLSTTRPKGIEMPKSSQPAESHSKSNYSSLSGNLRKTVEPVTASSNSNHSDLSTAPVKAPAYSRPSIDLNPDNIAAGAAVANAAQNISRGNISGALKSVFGAARTYRPQTQGYTFAQPYNPHQGAGSYSSGAGNSTYQAPVPNLASGRGTYSAMRESFQNQMLNSLPAAQPISVNLNADETQTLGLNNLERKAFGPPKLIRIPVPGVIPR